MSPSLILVSVVMLFAVVQGVVYDPVYYSANSHFYVFVTTTNPLNYTTSSSIAAALYLNGNPGYIVTETDMGEAQFVGNTIQSVPWTVSSTTGNTTYWSGLRRFSNATNLWSWFALNRISTPYYDSNTQSCLYGQYCNWETNSTNVNQTVMSFNLNNQYSSVNNKWNARYPNFTVDALIVEFDQSSYCQNGYMLNSANNFCIDYNECALGNICGGGYTCANRVGTYDCNDVDECAQNPNICPSGYSCVNTIGSYTCQDINECAQSPSVCPPGYACSNTVGSYDCLATAFYIKSNLNNLFVDINGTTAGSNCVMQPQKTTGDVSSQLWRLSTDGLLVSEATMLAMSVLSGVEEGHDVVLQPIQSTGQRGAQLWRWTQGFINIQSAPFTLDVFQANPSVGNKLIIWDTKTSDNLNQMWTFVND